MGLVRRVGGVRRRGRRLSTRILRPWRAGPKRSYFYVSLGVGFKRPVHTCVAWAFLGKRKTGRHKGDWQVNHKNGVTTDNQLTNLEYLRLEENHAHAVRLGLMARGERNGSAKLTAADIVRLRATTGTLKEVAEMFGVHWAYVSSVKHRRVWKHI